MRLVHTPIHTFYTGYNHRHKRHIEVNRILIG